VQAFAPQLGHNPFDHRVGLLGQMAVRTRLTGYDRATAVHDAHQPGSLELLVSLAHEHAADTELVLDMSNRRQQIAGPQLAEGKGDLYLLLELNVGWDLYRGVVMEQ
jgi:hypothetical protein